MKGDVPSSADDDVRKLNMWVEQHARQRAAALKKKFVSTKVANDMIAVARLTRENKTIGLALGSSGIGKTCSALTIHEKYVGSIFIRVITGYHHGKGITHAIAGKLEVRRRGARNSEQLYQMQLERVIDALRDSGRLLIIDEAHELEDGALRVLRDIHDTTGIPILLVATKDLHERILKNVDPDHGQLYSRCDVIYNLSEGHDVYGGGKPLFNIKQIKELYAEPKLRLSRDAEDYLQCIANDLGRGSLRRCERLLQNAVRRARKRQGLGEGSKVMVTADDLSFVEAALRREGIEMKSAAERVRRTAALVGREPVR